jgi:phosphoribosylanthranilate isomerase
MEIMRSIAVTGEHSIEIASSYNGIADFLLLDTHQPEEIQIGATGVAHDWNISRKIVQTVQIPVILAGGLGPDNVQEAIRQVRPAGVDSKTKTDRPGTHRKDLALVREFVQAARSLGTIAD